MVVCKWEVSFHCYRPQRKFGARVYFHKHLSFCPQGGVRAMHTPRACMPPRHTPPWAHSPPLGMHAPLGYYEMRSMSGRYASYWNAFLLLNYYIRFTLCRIAVITMMLNYDICTLVNNFTVLFICAFVSYLYILLNKALHLHSIVLSD